MNGRTALQSPLRNSVRFLDGGTGGTKSACRRHGIYLSPARSRRRSAGL